MSIQDLDETQETQADPSDHWHSCPTCHAMFICDILMCRANGNLFHMECPKCIAWESQWPYPQA